MGLEVIDECVGTTWYKPVVAKLHELKGHGDVFLPF